jgi:hypothetical protein
VRRRPRLYTSRYANTTLAAYPAAKVSITTSWPARSPSWRRPATWSNKTEAEFAALYTALLVERGGVEHLTRRFASVAAETGSDYLVLLCFEDLRKTGVFRHRRVFADWWEERTGQLVREIPDPQTSEAQ